MELKKENCAIEYWTKSFTYDNERIETLILLMKHFYYKNNHYMVNTFFHKFLNVLLITNDFYLILNSGGVTYFRLLYSTST